MNKPTTKKNNPKRQRRVREVTGLAKPHGQQYGVFTISIDDGYVEYAYQMDIGAHQSIAKVERKIRQALHCKKDAGKIRTPVSPMAFALHSNPGNQRLAPQEKIHD
jgi:hypothetical protein